MSMSSFRRGRDRCGRLVILSVLGCCSIASAQHRELVDPLEGLRAPHPAVEVQPDTPPEQPQAPRALYTVGPQGNCDFITLQAAINAAGDGDTIRVANNSGYLGQTYQIFGKGLIIQGGFDTCNLSESPSGRTTLDGNNASSRVFDIWQGSSPPNAMTVRLENLQIRRGNGGVLVEGQLGRLTAHLVNTEVSNNTTTNPGGGIRVIQTGTTVHTGGTPDPLLTVSNDSLIANNTSTGNGGGISCAASYIDTIRTSVRVGSTLMLQNAGYNGGAVANMGCQNMFLYNGGPIVLIIPTGGMYLNTATELGGAIHVSNRGTTFLSSNEFGGFGNPDHAAMVVSNSAQHGGAASVVGEDSELTLIGTVVSGNSASGEGGGILVRDGGSLEMRPASLDTPCLPAQSGGGVASQPPCSLLRLNESTSAGGALRILNGAQALIERTRIEDNVAGSSGTLTGAVAMVDRSDGLANVGSQLTIESSLLTGNAGGNLIYVGSGGVANLRWSTMADNTVSQALTRVFAAPEGVTSRLRFISSIVWGNNLNTLVTRGGAGSTFATADCAIGPVPQVDTQLTSGFLYRSFDPQFVDAAGGNFRVGPGSPAIDYCDDVNTPLVTRDLVGNLRGVVWPGPLSPDSPNHGPFDIGAYEAQFDSDLIFANGFE